MFFPPNPFLLLLSLLTKDHLLRPSFLDLPRSKPWKKYHQNTKESSKNPTKTTIRHIKTLENPTKSSSLSPPSLPSPLPTNHPPSPQRTSCSAPPRPRSASRSRSPRRSNSRAADARGRPTPLVRRFSWAAEETIGGLVFEAGRREAFFGRSWLLGGWILDGFVEVCSNYI